jgi:hypothetical protein
MIIYSFCLNAFTIVLHNLMHNLSAGHLPEEFLDDKVALCARLKFRNECCHVGQCVVRLEYLSLQLAVQVLHPLTVTMKTSSHVYCEQIFGGILLNTCFSLLYYRR